MRKWTKSACVVIAWSILAVAVALVSSRGQEHSAQANISIASSSTQATLASAPGTSLSVTAAPKVAAPPVTWTVRPGDTLSSIAAALALPGGWQALYHANRGAIGSDPDVIHPGAVLAVPGEGKPARHTVAPGDTLSGIAAALGVPGGWQALYHANRQVIGPDPGAIRAGTVLVVPRTAAAKQAANRQATNKQVAPPAAGAGREQAAPPYATAGGGRPPVRGRAVPAGATLSGGSTATADTMPSWLKVTLLAAALLTTVAFITEPVAVILGRRRRAARAARAPSAARVPSAGRAEQAVRAPAPGRDPGTVQAGTSARIVQADYDRLIVTYSVSDDTVYLLTPPGEDPRAVLRAARLVLPEDNYEELAGHLGVPSGWRVE